ncbi:taperin [Eublepharis macularius]|uniref:Taperin n=1 Tax=Eublepharis macularius TaxID=481883 RepID=A0AA97KDS5_EUBMA|nr:taperin [Eublepharis macularius]
MSSPPALGGAALPAWKRALMERKRAKLAAGVELQRGLETDAKPPPGSGTEREEGAAKERLVVAESLGPLRENPFMRLESERRRRRRRALPSPPRPAFPSSSSTASSASVEPPALAQLLELYSSVPGIRTIRADNILIIESREAELSPTATQKEDRADSPQQGQPASTSSSPPPPPSSPCGRDPFRDLLSRRGSAVTEIRAAEVVIYEPGRALPSSSTLDGNGGAESEPGRVSRLLQKFDRRPRSNVGRGRWRAGEVLRPQPVVPNLSQEGTPALLSLAPMRPGSPRNHPTGGFVQKIGSNSFTVNPRGCCPVSENSTPVLSNGPVEPIPPGSRNRQAVAVPKPVPSPSAAAASPPQANSWKPKLEGTTETPQLPAQQSSASLDSSATASSARPPPLLCSNGSFEIRPAPRPDLTAIPAHDLQAQALASLRLNSRNSFLFVPRRKGEAPGPLGPEVTPTLPGRVQPPAPEKRTETLVPVTYIDEDLVELDSGDLPPLKVLSPRLEGFDVLQEGDSSLGIEDLAIPIYRPHPTDYATVSEKGSNTFTIVPKRKPPSAALETFSRAQLPEEEEEEEEESRAKARNDVAHEDLGQRLKKRYPTVNEIEVIGGYLSLDKSCMSKSGSRRKKMKISFNETSLQTMFEYPSENSLVEAEEEEEEEYATEVDEKPALFIPRPNSTPNSNAVNSGLSSYTPKHSVEFSKWQEQQYEEIPPNTGAFPRDAALPGSQVMLTPADKSNLSDFGSEPALYF